MVRLRSLWKTLPLGWLLLLWLSLIFFFSALPGVPGAAEPTWSFVLERKGAHVFEYFVLTCLTFAFLLQRFGKKEWKQILLVAASFALMYGTTDELHQFFTPYRGAKLTDVLVDFVGILLATLVISFFRKSTKKK